LDLGRARSGGHRRGRRRVDALARPEIATVTPRRAEIVQTLVTIGRVAAPAQTTFAARESTKITRVGVEEGTHVGAGELDGRIVEDRTIDR